MYIILFKHPVAEIVIKLVFRLVFFTFGGFSSGYNIYKQTASHLILQSEACCT